MLPGWAISCEKINIITAWIEERTSIQIKNKLFQSCIYRSINFGVFCEAMEITMMSVPKTNPNNDNHTSGANPMSIVENDFSCIGKILFMNPNMLV